MFRRVNKDDNLLYEVNNLADLRVKLAKNIFSAKFDRRCVLSLNWSKILKIPNLMVIRIY